MSDRLAAIKAAIASEDPWLRMGGNEGLVNVIAAGIEAGLVWTPQCRVNGPGGEVCRMNENHRGATHRSADGDAW
jgi:hypothetical protein